MWFVTTPAYMAKDMYINAIFWTVLVLYGNRTDAW